MNPAPPEIKILIFDCTNDKKYSL